MKESIKQGNIKLFLIVRPEGMELLIYASLPSRMLLRWLKKDFQDVFQYESKEVRVKPSKMSPNLSLRFLGFDSRREIQSVM